MDMRVVGRAAELKIAERVAREHDLAFSRKVAGMRPALSAPFRHDSTLALSINCNNVQNVGINYLRYLV
jgi:hypothetical protein